MGPGNPDFTPPPGERNKFRYFVPPISKGVTPSPPHAQNAAKDGHCPLGKPLSLSIRNTFTLTGRQQLRRRGKEHRDTFRQGREKRKWCDRAAGYQQKKHGEKQQQRSQKGRKRKKIGIFFGKNSEVRGGNFFENTSRGERGEDDEEQLVHSPYVFVGNRERCLKAN